MVKEQGTKTPAEAMLDLYPNLTSEEAERLAELSQQLRKLNSLDLDSISQLKPVMTEARQLRQKGQK